MKALLPLLIVVCSVSIMFAKVTGKAVEYKSGDLALKGYLAYDTAVKGKRPGILVVHEWWGHNEHARKRAEMLAKLGYIALAVDMYGNGKTASHPEDAGKFSSEVMKNMPEAKARFVAAMDFLKAQEMTDADRIGAIGFCFGGGVVLNMARQGLDLKGVVSFHGSLAAAEPAEKGAIKAKILVCNGADDKFTTQEAIDKFKEEMESAGADFRFINYPGAMHSFTNPASTALGKKFNLPLAYNKEADEHSWADMTDFFRKVFGGM